MTYKLSEQNLTILKGAGIHSTINEGHYFYDSIFYENRFRYDYRNQSVGFRIIKLKQHA